MGDIRVKRTSEGIEIWRTAVRQKGKHVRVKGSRVVVKNRGEITAELPTFKRVVNGSQV